ncbi:hypothetical protein LO763_02050 [Glycomyces sp. A-F 0318]|uniref:hypothetical protein n=1 Tax=Glycomyces amatae TaxID=2881355 RepID=UPI001E55C522|nr:hypothetical protein [Glycomyces amatae]MCD0442406.1 hypothetical protein [Glycomyces amatae]
MALVLATDTHLTVRLTGARRAFGRWRPLTIPWRQVEAARVDAAAARAFPGARWGVSSYLPGVLSLGSFRKGGLSFWDVADPERAVVVELRGGKYDRLVLEVEDPAATVADIRAHLDRVRD